MFILKLFCLFFYAEFVDGYLLVYLFGFNTQEGNDLYSEYQGNVGLQSR